MGREPVAAEELAARFLSRVLRDVAAREGAVAERVAVTHPAGWGRTSWTCCAARWPRTAWGSAVLLSEPQAAAGGYADTERVEPGATVAVYDLGGGTFDAAVVRKTVAGGFELLGTPEGIDQLGGVDFDEAVFAHVRAALGADWAALDASDPKVLAAVAGLRRECTAAKEALSHDTEVLVPVLLPGVCTQARLGREERVRGDDPAGRGRDGGGAAPRARVGRCDRRRAEHAVAGRRVLADPAGQLQAVAEEFGAARRWTSTRRG